MLKLNTRAGAADLRGYDEVVLATGVLPRTPAIPGIGHPSVLSYVDLIRGAPVGRRVAIIGAGGIGFDVSTFLTHETLDRAGWMAEWGIDGEPRRDTPPPRQVYLLQRKTSRMGAGLGKTTGWVHRLTLRRKQVEMITGVCYDRIDDGGLQVTVGGRSRLLEVDNVVVCAGQEPLRDLAGEIRDMPVHLVGGADIAAELDAKRAIEQATRLALTV